MRTVLDDESLRTSLAEAGHREVLMRFGCDRTGTRYERMYAAVLHGDRGAIVDAEAADAR
jgi:hypothetical protein